MNESQSAAPRARQRQLLSRLTELAAEQPPRDRAAAQALAEATREADRDLAKVQSAAKARFDTQRDAATAARDNVVAEADSKLAERSARLDKEMQAARKSVATQHKRRTHAIWKDRNDAEWLAGVTRDAERGRAEHEHKELVDKLDAHRNAIDAKEAELAELARSYWMPAAAHGEAAAAEPSDDAAAASETAIAAGQRASGYLPPKLVAGATPWLTLFFAALAGAAVAVYLDVKDAASIELAPTVAGIGAGAGAAAVVMVGALIYFLARGGFAARVAEFREKAASARASLAAATERAERERDATTEQVEAAHVAEVEGVKGGHDPKLRKVNAERDATLAAAEAKATAKRRKYEAEHAEVVGDAEAKHSAAIEKADAGEAAEVKPAQEARDALVAEATAKRQAVADDTAAAVAESKEILAALQALRGVMFGSLHYDPATLDENGDGLDVEAANVPAFLSLPGDANLLFRHEGGAGEAAAVEALRATVLGLLTGLPAGRVHLTMIDASGLGREFAAFMHLADYDEQLVGGRVLTETDAVAERLAELTEHMETVIQKYLRNEFATIDDYNSQAGELAEPYRFVVVNDLPNGFNEDALRRLVSIAASGPRCGVHVLVAQDTRKAVPGGGSYLDDLARHCDTIEFDQKEFQWRDGVYGRLPIALATAPADAELSDLVHKAGAAAKEAKKVELAFEPIAPGPDELWSLDSSRELAVPVGRTGAARVQTFRLGRGVAQHALVAGKTGSGKSTLLNVLVTNLALWYGPDQLEIYLVDFKRGVEFKAYATGGLPHARAVAVESDREFGVSVLQRLDEELGRRGDLFRSAGVQDLAGFRAARPDESMPRVLLVIDEFHELFAEDDKLGQDAALLIDRLVRQGRAFGMHAILGSQTVGGATGMTRATYGQIAVRVALQCSEADSRLILGDNNAAARLLSRPGEAIYNDAGGAVENNSPFQVAWLPDPEREAALRRAREEAERRGLELPALTVFEGNAPARVEDNGELAQAAAGSPPRANVAYLGEAVAIRPPTHVAFRRQSGANLLVVGQQEESASAILATSIISLTRTNDRRPRFVVLDGSPADAPLAGLLRDHLDRLDAEADVVDPRAAPDALSDLAEELQQRSDGSADEGQSIFVIIRELQRFRTLSRDDDFGLSPRGGGGGFGSILGDGDDEKPAVAERVSPSRALSNLLRDGPAVGIHVIASVDTLASVERRISRDDLREFDRRVLFQMSANDSSVLIDSPAANALGFYRALLASEERGTREKFRPYDVPRA